MSAHVCPEYDDTDPSLMLFSTGGLDGKRHLIGWAVCAVLATLSTAISFLLMYRHAKNYTKPSEQRHIMRIVAMIPVYAICSGLSYRFYKNALYFETVRDCYEAFVIYSFFVLLLTYLGDDCFLEFYGLYCETVYDWHFGMVYITIINFISVSVALYCLVLFYQTIKDEIQDHEMVVFSILHVYSFSYRPYVVPGVRTPVWRSLQDGFNPLDMIREIIWASTDFCLLIQGKPLPVRDGVLSTKLKRAHTIRVRKLQRFFKSRKPTEPIVVDPRIEEIYQSTLEAEERREVQEQQEQQEVLASLLNHTDGKCL
ncbi:hypothetical protein BGX24_005351 [Mortierella sp. AD032]|nr:hypothetical protein BGX24_005351 [Mortierella sp. AD032]